MVSEDLVRYLVGALDGEALGSLSWRVPHKAHVFDATTPRKLWHTVGGHTEEIDIVRKEDAGGAVVCAHLAGRIWLFRVRWQAERHGVSVVEVVRRCAEPVEGVAHHAPMMAEQAHADVALRSAPIAGTASAMLLLKAWRQVVVAEAERIAALVPDGWGAPAQRWQAHMRRVDPYGRAATAQLWALLEHAPPAHRVAPLDGGSVRVEWVRGDGREALGVSWDGLSWVGASGWPAVGVSTEQAADYAAAWVDGRESYWVGGGQ